MPNPRRTPGALAAGLTQNAATANQMGNIYAGSRMSATPKRGMFIAGQTPQGAVSQQQDPRAARRAQMAAWQAANPTPYGEGKEFSTYEDWNNAKRQAQPWVFDWSREDNSPEAVANQMNIERMAAESAQRMGMEYKTPDVIANALSKYKLDPSMANFGQWSEQDYKDRGYALQDPTDVQKKFGITAQQWVKNPAAQAPQTPPMQESAQQAPASQPAMQTAQQPTGMNQPTSGFNGLQTAAAPNQMGKGGKSLPQKGNQFLPRP